MVIPPHRVFRASYDDTTKVLSAVISAALLGSFLISQNLVLLCVAILILVPTYAWSPRSYIVTEEAILVRRLIGPAELRLEDAVDAREARREDFRGTLRLWGSGGLFGYFGIFRTPGLGNCRWYVTNRSNMVIVSTRSKTAVFSPDDVKAFLAAVRASAKPDIAERQ
jgi:hypothetical protein